MVTNTGLLYVEILLIKSVITSFMLGFLKGISRIFHLCFVPSFLLFLLLFWRKQGMNVNTKVGEIDLVKAKKKTSLFPVAGLKIAMRNAVSFFFFYNSWKSNAQCGFYFFKQNFRKKIHQNNSLGFFSTFIKNITSFISKWFMWPFILHALGASLMNFLPWPKLHHIWKKIQSKCTECM